MRCQVCLLCPSDGIHSFLPQRPKSSLNRYFVDYCTLGYAISIKRVCKLWFPEDLLGYTECPVKNDTNMSELYNIEITHLFQKYYTILEFAIRHACTINTL